MLLATELLLNVARDDKEWISAHAFKRWASSMGSLRPSGGFLSQREGFSLVEMLEADANETTMSYLTFMT